jgi:hypothetical protein
MSPAPLSRILRLTLHRIRTSTSLLRVPHRVLMDEGACSLSTTSKSIVMWNSPCIYGAFWMPGSLTGTKLYHLRTRLTTEWKGSKARGSGHWKAQDWRSWTKQVEDCSFRSVFRGPGSLIRGISHPCNFLASVFQTWDLIHILDNTQTNKNKVKESR